MPYSDPEERQRYNAAYKRRNRWRYRASQKIYDAAKHANQRAAGYGAPGVITPEDVASVLAAGSCHYCGGTESKPWWTIDHVVGLHAGGPNELANLVCCCQPCNVSKSRGTAPWCWSQGAPCCVSCETVEVPHAAHGYCRRCYHQLRHRAVTEGNGTAAVSPRPATRSKG